MARKANAERGEHSISLGGKTYVLRPSHAAITAIEEETGRATLALVRLGNCGELSLKQLGIIGAELIRAGADEDDEFTQSVDAERIEQLVFENPKGLPEAQSRFGLCLLDAATGGRTVSGEAKAAPAKPTKGRAGAASPA